MPSAYFGVVRRRAADRCGGRSQVPAASGLVRGLLEMPVPEAQRHAERAAGIAGRRLDPDLLERAFAQDAAVADAVERHAAGQAQIAHAGLAMRERGHLQHHLFGDVLDRPRQVHFALRQRALGLARRAAEQPLEPPTRSSSGRARR